MVYYLKTLGELSIHEDGPDREPLLKNSKSLALLAYLAATSGRRARRDRLAHLFWPDTGRSRGLQSLRQALYYLRTRVGADLVLTDDDAVVLDDDSVDVDLWELNQAVRNGRHERIVELYDGPFLDSFRGRLGRELETWVEARNERVWTALKAALHQLVRASLEAGRTEEAVGYARRYARLNPFDESARLALVRALAAAGRTIEAIQAYESYRSLLSSALDDEPGRELREVVENLRERVFEGPGGGSTEPPAADGDPGPVEAASDRAPDPASRPDPDDLRPVAAAGVVVLVLAILMGSPEFGPATATDGTTEATPTALVVTAGSDANITLLSVGDSVVLETARADGSGLPDPAGQRVALSHRSADGFDLAVRNASSGSVSLLTSRPHDEAPMAWSPDGRHLVYLNGWMGEDGIHYQRRLRIRDLETGTDRRLTDVPVPPQNSVVWDPSGAWIAFDGLQGDGNRDIWIVRPDGSDARRLTDGTEPDAEPDFSPDGRWVAYASGPPGGRSLFLTRIDGTRTIPLVDTGFDDHHPVWRTESRVLFLSTRDGRTQLWEYDLDQDRRRRLTEADGFNRMSPHPRRYRDRWIAELRIAPRPEAVSPGQWLSLRSEGRTPEGTRVGAGDEAVVWSTPTPDVVHPAGGSLFRVRAPGHGRIVARIPGWRSDTLRLRSRRPVVGDPPLLFEEDWSEEPFPDEWYTVGAPEPGVVERPGRFRRVLRNNGDAHFSSGVISAEAFPTDDGLTLEAWVRAPMTGRHYQLILLALHPDPDPPGIAEWSGGTQPIGVAISGSPDGVTCQVNGRRLPVPAPDSLDTWRRLAVQLHPDGRTSVLLDGALFWVEPSDAREPPPRRVHAVVGGRTVGTDVLVGPVTLHRGVRYVLP